MTGEEIFGVIIMTGIGFLCGALFFGIGIWAERSKKPVHFWTGSTVDPKTVVDIPAYNRENARMWKVYSVPYWLCGIFALLSIINIQFSAVSHIMIIVATVGIVWLILRYNRICKKYIV